MGGSDETPAPSASAFDVTEADAFPERGRPDDPQ